MEHNEAQSTQAVERYLLDEMTRAEREGFEDHFFECAECGEAVRTGSLMMANGAAAARTRVPGGARPVGPSVAGRVVEMPVRSGGGAAGRSSRRPWLHFGAVAAALMAISVGVYQAAPGRDFEARVRLADQTRGEAVGVPAAKAGQLLEAEVAVLRPREWYAVELIGRGEPVVLAKSAPLKDGMISVSLPKNLAEGRYDVVVRETPGGKLTARYPLRVEK